ncbi:hypothetical protein [Aeromicrobium sp. Sec7.5]|uniref:hypothetical protein n=1 Tax=Aeromicrobium sp. Sec7.5 TaxID=3121276 RepID=UPI002FE44086
MRWDRLLAEIEASQIDDAALERDALASELVDEEWAEARARDLIWGEVALEVSGVGWIEGRVIRSAEDFVVLSDQAREMVVARSAVLGWRGGGGRAPELRGVAARLGWSQVLRALRDDAEDVRLVRVDGSHVTGRVEAVARDAVRLGQPGTGPSGFGPSGPWVVLPTVATLQVL